MRAAPTVLDYSQIALYDTATSFTITGLVFDGNSQGLNQVLINATGASGGTQYRPIQLIGNFNTGSYLGFGAEL